MTQATQKERPNVVNEADAAKYLGLSKGTLQNYRLKGKSKRGKYGPAYIQYPGFKGIRYRIADLDKWLQDNMRGGA